MAEAQQIAVSGHNLPGATLTERTLPNSNQQTEGYVQHSTTPADAAANIRQKPAPVPPGIAASELEEYQEFLKFKATKAAGTQPAAAPAATLPAQVLVSPNAALDLAVNAAKSDPMLDSMLGIFDSAASGIDRSRALGNALTHGDASLIDVAYLKEVGGANGDRLVQIAKGIVTHCVEAANSATAAVYTAAGGEANWHSATAAFNKGAPDHLKQFVAHALDSGNRAQIEAGAKTVIEFAKSSGLVAVPGTGHVQSGGGAPGSAQGLSKEEFQRLHSALNKNDRQYEQKKGELFGRRAIGKQAGL